jgi:hypothetical protein
MITKKKKNWFPQSNWTRTSNADQIKYYLFFHVIILIASMTEYCDNWKVKRICVTCRKHLTRWWLVVFFGCLVVHPKIKLSMTLQFYRKAINVLPRKSRTLLLKFINLLKFNIELFTLQAQQIKSCPHFDKVL